MSSLLQDAIVDAKALRETALRNAEATIIDKYSNEVRSTLNKLIEQDDVAEPLPGADAGLGLPALGDIPGAPVEDPMDPMALGGDIPGEEAPEITEDDDSIPFSASDNVSKLQGQNVGELPRSGEDVEVALNLGALQEAVNMLKSEIEEADLDEEIDLDEAALLELFADDEEILEEEEADDEGGSSDESSEDVEFMEQEHGAAADPAKMMADATQGHGLFERDINITDEMIDDIVERLTVDMGAELAGWAGRSSHDMRWQIKKELAHRRSTDVQKDLENLKQASEELVFENKQLKESLEQYKQTTHELKENLHDVNLSNARLLYTNRILKNASLNERQKEKIVEAISKAGSVTEAKTIYHTLENATPAATKRSPQSLSEALGRRGTSVIRASRQDSTTSDPFQDRMKKLAGIK